MIMDNSKKIAGVVGAVAAIGIGSLFIMDKPNTPSGDVLVISENCVMIKGQNAGTVKDTCINWPQYKEEIIQQAESLIQ